MSNGVSSQVRYWNVKKDKVTTEWKYRIRGETIGGGEVEVVAKLGPTGKLVIITVYIP